MKKLNIIYLCICAVLLYSACSCGARKVNKSQSNEETTQTVTDNSIVEKQSETNVKTTTIVTTDDKNETITKKTTYEPKDNSKESSITESDGTKTILNNTKKTVEETIKKNNVQSESKTDVTEKQNNASKEQKAVKHVNATKKETKSKQVDKKQFNPLVSIVLVTIGLILLWCVYRFYKKLPLVPKL